MLALFGSMFSLGLVTSIHCVSMCGPMVLSYAVKGEEHGPWHRKLIPNLAYQGAKVTSYILVGLVLGAIGSAFNLNGVRPYIMVVAGAGFLLVYCRRNQCGATVLRQRFRLPKGEQFRCNPRR